MNPDRTMTWRPAWPCPAGQILGVHRRGAGDPSYRLGEDGSHWRGVRTPQGPATMRMRMRTGRAEVVVDAWGEGADWLLESVPALLGADDDPDGFEPTHPVLAAARERHPHWRIGRTGLVWDSLLPAIIEQKVTGQEAFGGYAALVRRYGERAPGPHPTLRVPPGPEVVRTIPSWEWLRLHIDPARSTPIVKAAARGSAVERIVRVSWSEADRRLQSLTGVGVWTSAEVRSRALGDPDAVSFGDYHVAKDIGWALTGAAVDDDGLRELLEPWVGHRYRVQALLGLAGHRRPRRGPRMAPRTHLPVRR